MRIIASTLPIVATLCAAQAPEQSAIDQLHSLRAKAAEAIRSDDWQSNLDWSNQVKQLLNSSPNSLLTVARAETHLGNFDAAFHEIDQFVRMGQATDAIETLPDFAPLRAKEQFQAIASGMKANQTPISRASTAFLLSDPGLLTEDIDFDPVAKHSSSPAFARRRFSGRVPTARRVSLPGRPTTYQSSRSRSIHTWRSMGHRP